MSDPSTESELETPAADAPAEEPTGADGSDGGGTVEPDHRIPDEPSDDVPASEQVEVIEPPEFIHDETARLRATVAELEARLKKVSAAYRQQVEEVEATKERLGRQAAYREERRRGEVVGTLFEPVENLKRSIEVVRKSAGQEVAQGLDLVLQQFLDAFQKLGLEEVPGKGAKFDPKLHEALTMMPVTDPALDGVVVEVFDTGYRIGTNLLKPARVIVGQLQEGVGEA